MKKLLLFPSKNLVYVIPVVLIIGFILGLNVSLVSMKQYILPLTFFMIYPTMIGFDIKKVADLSNSKIILLSLVSNFLLIPLIALSVILNSCSSLGEAGKVLRNEKRNSTDEFLVKKKEPLTQPPDFTKIPEPGSIQKNIESEQNSIETIIKRKRSESNSGQTKTSSVEKSIIDQIKK